MIAEHRLHDLLDLALRLVFVHTARPKVKKWARPTFSGI
jgi:hypothetical protein